MTFENWWQLLARTLCVDNRASVYKRYNEFKRVRKTLLIYIHPGCRVSALAPQNVSTVKQLLEILELHTGRQKIT